MSWRRQTKGKLPNLPHERKALAERYTIDADEADRRARRAVEEAAAEEAAREAALRAAEEEEAARAAASVVLERELAEQAEAFASSRSEREVAPEPAGVEPLLPDSSEPVAVADPAGEEGSAQGTELPIYRWFGNE
jgi:hypothetical protein